MILCCLYALVATLGHPSYQQREMAHRHLRSLGMVAEPALIEGVESRDLEIVRRAELLLRELPFGEFPHDVQLDLADHGWQRFRNGYPYEGLRLFNTCSVPIFVKHRGHVQKLGRETYVHPRIGDVIYFQVEPTPCRGWVRVWYQGY